ncbi:MAG TPA: OmpA family protein, partial [Opitutaceae bacterium]
MKLASKSLCIVAASAAAFLAGCAKKPVRPDPSATALGPQSGNAGSLTPSEVSVAPDTTLQARDANGGIIDGNLIRGLLQPVYFDFDRSEIKGAERPKLQAAKDYIDKNPQYHLLVEGHCDWRGTAEYNLALGDRRASEAKKYLLSLGVPADKVETLSKGSEEAKK